MLPLFVHKQFEEEKNTFFGNKTLNTKLAQKYSFPNVLKHDKIEWVNFIDITSKFQ